jgi:hypothetical protein
VRRDAAIQKTVARRFHGGRVKRPASDGPPDGEQNSCRYESADERMHMPAPPYLEKQRTTRTSASGTLDPSLFS